MEKELIFSKLTQVYFDEIQICKKARLIGNVEEAHLSIAKANGILDVAEVLGIPQDEIKQKFFEMELVYYVNEAQNRS